MKMPSASAGSVCIAQLTWDYGSFSTVTPPTGWNTIRVDNVDTWRASQGLYWHVTGSTEPAAYTWAINWSPQSYLGYAGGIACYRGVSTTAPFDAAAPQGTSQTVVDVTQVTAPSISTSTNGDMLVIALMGNNQYGTWQVTGNYSNAWKAVSQGCYLDSLLGDRLQSSAGPSGAQTGAFSVAAPLIGVQLALHPK